MSAHPRAIPTNNCHQIILHQPDAKGSDFGRIEDMAAQANNNARVALGGIKRLPYYSTKPFEQAERILRKAVSNRRVLNDNFRDAALELFRGICELECLEEYQSNIESILQSLRKAVELSQYVSDLLAAEQEIGEQRGIVR